MSIPTIDDVRQFMDANKAFFETPLKDQDKFKEFFEKKGEIDAIADYSAKFFQVLNKTLFKSGNYKGPVLILWKQENFEEAIQHKEVRQFIMDNANHPAIKAWQTAHPPLDVPKKTTVCTEEEREFFLKAADKLKVNLEDAIKKLNEYKKELEKTISPTEHTATNIILLKQAIKEITTEKRNVLIMKTSLTNESPETKRTEIFTQLKSIKTNLENTITKNLLNVHHEKPVISLGEKLLDIVSRFLGLGGYQSEETKAAEKRGIELSNLGQKLPGTMSTAFMHAKEEMTKLKEQKNQDPEPESPKTNVTP